MPTADGLGGERSSSAKRGRTLRRRWIVGAALALSALAVWAIASAMAVASARSDAEAAMDLLLRVDGSNGVVGLFDSSSKRDLAEADERLAEAAQTLESPLVAPVRWLPMVGPRASDAQRWATEARRGVGRLRESLATMERLRARPMGQGVARLAVLDVVVAEADEAAAVLDGLDLEGDPGLGGERAERARARLDEAVADLNSTAEVVETFRSLLAGPSRVLVLGANNAEMRLGTGKWLSAAVMEAQDGAISMNEVMPTAPLAAPGADFRELGVERFEQDAATAARWWADLGLGEVDAVVVVDVEATRLLLDVVGPVEVDGSTYRAEGIRDALLRDQYREFGDDRSERRDRLGDVAVALFEHLDDGDWDVVEMADAMGEALSGRHLMVWSADPTVQATWADATLSGPSAPTAVEMGLVNESNNKLDSYVLTEADVVIDGRDATLAFRVENTAPSTGPRYLVGPNLAGMGPGQYRGVVKVRLPAGWRPADAVGATPGGERGVLDFPVDLMPGERAEVVVAARLPDDADEVGSTTGAVVIEPTARQPATEWKVNGESRPDRRYTVATGDRAGSFEEAGDSYPRSDMIELDAASFLLQWAVGGLAFTWVTTRRREVGLGYGWLMRGVFAFLALASVAVARVIGSVPVRDASAVAVAVATLAALWVSVQRRSAGVAGQREVEERRSSRVAAMTGIDRDERRFDRSAPEFPPNLDLIAPAIGVVGLVAAGIDAGSPAWLSVLRMLVGAAFLGAVTDAMLLGHWYLVQPGLARGPLLELVRASLITWPLEVAVMLIPTGMVSVLNGSIDDGYGGILGWMWLTCAVTTGGLLFVTRQALKERQYSAVMAATGLLYLAILTAFGTDLVARAVLA